MSEKIGEEWTLSPEKRAMDLALLGAMTPLLVPTSAVIMGTIATVDRMNPLFSHTRVGLDGEEFTFYKFRTMQPHEPAHVASAGGRRDTRRTKLGAHLSHANIDEIPQAVNIFNGTMSAIGPRPLVTSEASHTMDVLSPTEQRAWLSARKTALPGVFGLFQLEQHKTGYSNGGTLYARAMSDIEYATTASFKGDMRILALSAFHGMGIDNLLQLPGTRKRGTRGARMLATVAGSMGAPTTDAEREYWRCSLLASRTIDTMVDDNGLKDTTAAVEKLLAGHPVGDMTGQEAEEFSEAYWSAEPAKRQVLAGALLSLPQLLARKQQARTVSALTAINTLEAQLSARVLALDESGNDIGARQRFNKWLGQFTVAGYAADTVADLRSDYEGASHKVAPTLRNRIALSRQAFGSIKHAAQQTLVLAYPRITTSAVRTLAA